MRERIDLSALPRLPAAHAVPVWWGVAGLVVIEAMLVASFIASYFYLRLYHAVWPPAGVAPPPGLPTVELALLLGSCVTLKWAGRMLDHDRRARFLLGVGAGLVLTGLVLALRAQQFASFAFRWDSHPYGSIVWTLLGFHTVLVMTAVLWMAVVALLGLRGFITARRRITADAATLYWCFVGWVWIPLYLVLVWAPRWL